MIQETLIFINASTAINAHTLIDKALEEKEQYCMEIKKAKKRSLSQNALFHMWCAEIAKFFIRVGKKRFECGALINKDTMKYRLKSMYLHTIVELKWSYDQCKFVRHTIPAHTSKLPKGDMFAFMTKIQVFCVEHSIPITIPVDSDFYELMQRAA